MCRGIGSVTVGSAARCSQQSFPFIITNGLNVYMCRAAKFTDTHSTSFFNYTPEEANLMDPQMRIFHECSWDALEDAGYNPYKYEGAIGVYAGASINPYYAPTIGQNNHEKWMDDWQSHIYSTQDYLCSRVSYKLNLRGPSVNISTACSSSLVAIDTACRDLLSDRCDQ